MRGDYHQAAEAQRHQIYTFAFYSLRNREDAEDVTQEVLIRLWKHWQRLDKGGLRAWVIQVTRNLCRDLARQRSRRWREADAEEVPVDALPAAEDPGADAEAEEFRRRLSAALRQIPEPYRSALILREIQDLKYDEIAVALDRPLNTVKVYLHRGRKMLRRQLSEETLASAVEGDVEPAAPERRIDGGRTPLRRFGRRIGAGKDCVYVEA